ncbi:MAG: transposase [candidate division WOR-3 bacterium]
MELIRKDFMKFIREDFIKVSSVNSIKVLRLNSRKVSRLNSKRHQPIHFYLDNTFYFLTAHTYQDQPILSSDSYKIMLLKKIRKWLKEYHYNLFAWVILDNHYHLLFQTQKGADLPKITAKIHTGFSYEVNKRENKQGRKIWQNYWDKCLRSEKDFWRHFNYVHHNPIKHNYVKQMEDYKFSSFNYWLKVNGINWLMSVFERYPIIDFTIEGD